MPNNNERNSFNGASRIRYYDWCLNKVSNSKHATVQTSLSFNHKHDITKDYGVSFLIYLKYVLMYSCQKEYIPHEPVDFLVSLQLGKIHDKEHGISSSWSHHKSHLARLLTKGHSDYRSPICSLRTLKKYSLTCIFGTNHQSQASKSSAKENMFGVCVCECTRMNWPKRTTTKPQPRKFLQTFTFLCDRSCVSNLSEKGVGAKKEYPSSWPFKIVGPQKATSLGEACIQLRCEISFSLKAEVPCLHLWPNTEWHGLEKITPLQNVPDKKNTHTTFHFPRSSKGQKDDWKKFFPFFLFASLPLKNGGK